MQTPQSMIRPISVTSAHGTTPRPMGSTPMMKQQQQQQQQQHSNTKNSSTQSKILSQ